MTNELVNIRYSNTGEIVDLKEISSVKSAEADDVIEKVVKAVAGASGGKAIKDATSKETRYVVNMTDEVKHAIESGKIKLDTNKAGETFAQIRNGNKYGSKFSITKEMARQGIDAMDVTQAMQIKAVEEKLDKIADVLDDIENSVYDVIQGQQNDRFALFYSGIDLYFEAQNIQDENFKKFMMSQALKSIGDGSSQVIENIRTDLKYLVDEEYNNEKKGKQTEAIDEKMVDINKCFQVIHNSYRAKAEIYYENNEILAMLSVLDEYGKFLESEISPISGLLCELDKRDRLLKDGKWESRSKLLTDIAMTKDMLQSNSFYLVLEGK